MGVTLGLVSVTAEPIMLDVGAVETGIGKLDET